MLGSNATERGVNAKRGVVAKHVVVAECGIVVAERGIVAERSIIAEWCGVVTDRPCPSVASLLPSGAAWHCRCQAEWCDIVV